MITGKQRSYLKSMANNIDSIFQIGKGGISDNLIKQVDDALNAREIVKISILKNNELDPTEVALLLAEKLNAEFVQSIGKKFTLYRESEKNKKIELPK
ncbi:MAG: ribosome assembly RNA-binding protein YhbY [Gudongella sp.]|nr:ribosome assembly RNA-binding protein YhbY [Gudongella sp.]